MHHITEILDSILPPREWYDVGQKWVQKVSSMPATNLDVITLQEHLDRELLNQRARETTICPKRMNLYAETLDELIRQVTIACTERGLFLLRVRDEIRMTVAAYQTIYESSIGYGMRASLQTEGAKRRMAAEIESLVCDNEQLRAEIRMLEARGKEIQVREADSRAAAQKLHDEEITKLKRTNIQRTADLEELLKVKK